MDITALPLLDDNYAWLLTVPGSSACAVVDPSEADPVAQVLAERKLDLKCILATHHHPDHVGGIKGLVKPGVEVVCSSYDKERIPCVTKTVEHGERIDVLGEQVQCIMVPGHTLGAVSFYFAKSKAVFTGDTLFLGGCGRLFEGTPEMMHKSLSELAALPGDVDVYCGHEYTEKNMKFALSLEPNARAVKERLARVEKLLAEGKPTVPATLDVERKTNPFLRVSELRAIAGKQQDVEVFAELRQRRDKF